MLISGKNPYTWSGSMRCFCHRGEVDRRPKTCTEGRRKTIHTYDEKTTFAIIKNIWSPCLTGPVLNNQAQCKVVPTSCHIHNIIDYSNKHSDHGYILAFVVQSLVPSKARPHQRIWMPRIGDKLSTDRELTYKHDGYALHPGLVAKFSNQASSS